MQGLRGRLPGGEAEHSGMGPAVVLGQDLAERAGPEGDGAVADLAAREGKTGNGHREAAGIWLAHHLHDASPAAVTLPLHARRGIDSASDLDRSGPKPDAAGM